MMEPSHDLEYWLNQLNAPQAPQIDPFTAGREFLIYGAGNRGREALCLLQNRGCAVRGFLDGNATPGKTINGIPIVRLDECHQLGDLSGIAVLVAIFNPAIAISPIFTSLREAGFENLFSFYDFDAVFHQEMRDFLWLTSRQFWHDHATEIKQLAGLLHDTESRGSLAGILGLRLSGEFLLYESKRRSLEEQYFAPEITDWSQVERLIDCGAFDGDTIDNALLHCALKEVAAFEPDEANFRTLARRFKEGAFGDLQGLLWPCGVWSQTTTLRFRAGQEAGSHLDVNGESVIACTSLDEVLSGFSPDYIKMDIEGAEPQALHGAREMIAKHRPLLAVCLYHAPQHLWEIPFLIEDWNLEYSFFLRSHQFNGFDSVLYAIPQF